MQITLTFNEPLNFSLAIGDTIHYSSPAMSGGYQVSQDWEKLGEVVEINGKIVTVKNDTILLPPVISVVTSYFSFTKPNKVNLTNLTGYFAEVQFVNNDKKKAELFAVGSEVVESSK